MSQSESDHRPLWTSGGPVLINVTRVLDPLVPWTPAAVGVLTCAGRECAAGHDLVLVPRSDGEHIRCLERTTFVDRGFPGRV